MSYFDKFKEVDYVRKSDFKPLELVWAIPTETNINIGLKVLKEVYKKTLDDLLNNKVNQNFWLMNENLEKKEYDLIVVAENLFPKDKINQYCFNFNFNNIRKWSEKVNSLFMYSTPEYEKMFFYDDGNDMFDHRISSLNLTDFIYKILEVDRV